ncbi:helix-turn-helix domain-containing protein [Reichenbachiella ulvae]|uniref:Helix-turn-helix domain-containing protein n=1 Tax=Reichenbachiella ulvae TaxID=2980104 RepID=A0ABT3CRU3_9BACT|nr:helix-turn-helix domain-containing protein [Reichenbachiella ulvae]MCV9386420.1 helix-turn-helix domain-containing protein [Reichenbachiella ulvae]
MNAPDSVQSEFTSQLIAIIHRRMSDDQFGVSELAEEMNMSRSNLLRKVKKSTGQSASQYIRQVRLERAMELLRAGDLNVSEVAFQVGFGSSSYFIRCFKEQFGYSPGEVHKIPELTETTDKRPSFRPVIVIGILGLLGLVLVYRFFFYEKKERFSIPQTKSIAVLPFINESSDSTNGYWVNGLMLSVLNNLQKLEDLKVVSRTSVEKFRESNKTIPEIAQELQVAYVLEGSGQKVGNRILLNVQLVDAANDRQIWSSQYDKELKGVFDLQKELSQRIAENIQVVIKPDEAERINQPLTENIEAYDHFLKAKMLMSLETKEGLLEAIPLLEQSIELDPSFASSYAYLAIAYYYLELYQSEKEHTAELGLMADKALLYDHQLPEALIAKAMYYLQTREFDEAKDYLEKAHEYHPGSTWIINMLSDFYTNYSPNTAKYLEYALKAVRLNPAGSDSTATSYIYLHLSNALIQSGFVDEALLNINLSLGYFPENPFSSYLKAYILLAKDRDFEATEDRMIFELDKDTTRLDIMQEVAKLYYMQGDFESAHRYYERFLKQRERRELTMFRHEQAKMAFTFKKLGYDDRAEELIVDFLDFAEKDQSIYKSLHLAMYHSYRVENDKAIEYIQKFSEEDNYNYWVVLFFDQDPLDAAIRDTPEFKRAFQTIKTKFWKQHLEIKERLKEEGLLLAS